MAITETAAPRHIAPYAFALSAEVEPPAGPDADTRLILLHDPRGHESWNGTLRLITYLSVEVAAEGSHDPAPVAWSWLLDGLSRRDARFAAVGGTVTHSTSTRFGQLRDPDDGTANRESTLELRASWTPRGDNLAAHAKAWRDLLAAACGMPSV